MGRDKFTKPCDECNQDILVVKVDDKWKVYQAGTTTEHWLVCPSEDARQRRIRAGREAYTFPLSPSAIGDYRDCPRYFLFRKFKALKNLGLVSPTLEKEVRKHFPDGEPKMPDIRAGHLGRACHVYFAERLRGKSKEEAKAAAVLEGIPLEFWRDFMIMSSIFDSQLEAGMWNTQDASVEDRLNYEWKEGEITVQLQVVVDFWRIVNGRSFSSDFKTGRAVDDVTKLGQDIQAQTNVLVIQRQLPDLKGGRFEQVQLRYQGDEPVGVEFDQRELDAIEVALRSEVHQILQDREFIPNPYCSVCPPGAHPMASYPIAIGDDGEAHLRIPQSLEDAEKLAALVTAARRIASAGLEALKPFCDVHGEVGGFAYYVKTSYELVPNWTETIPAIGDAEPVVRKLSGVERLEEVVRQHGHLNLLSKLVRADGTTLRSIRTAKKYASLAEAIKPLLIPVEKPEFEYRSKPVASNNKQATITQLPQPPEALPPPPVPVTDGAVPKSEEKDDNRPAVTEPGTTSPTILSLPL